MAEVPQILSSRATGEQQFDRALNDIERQFIERVAFPQLDEVRDDRTLEKFFDMFWNLCLWEQQRTSSLDTKAAALTGLSSLAAAVVSASTIAGAPPSNPELVARCFSIALFIVTVLLSLNVQRVIQLGGFHDADAFGALGAHKAPVGTAAFSDQDPHRCFLREASLQRWLAYRSHADANDQKYRRLGCAQAAAALAVVSLAGVVLSVLW